MSLLMDALKRAEKARQAEAERAKAEGRATAEPELSLDPIEDTAARPDASGEAQETPPPREAGTDTEDSLEFTPDAVRRAVESMPDPVFEDSSVRWESEAEPGPGPLPAPGARNGAGGQDASTPLSLDYSDIPPDETGSTMPSMRAAQRSVQDYFDGTHSVSMSMEDVRDAIESDGGATPVPEVEASAGTFEGDTTSRQRAQAVLDARAVAPSRTGRNVAIVLIVLLLVAGVTGGAFMYRDQIMAIVGGQPTVIARPVPSAPPASREAAPVTVAAADRPAEVAAAERDALLRAAEQAREEERRIAQEEAAAKARADEEARAAALATERQAQAAAQAVADRSAATRDAAPAAGDGSRTGTEVVLAEVLRAAPPAAPAPPPSAFKISRTRRASRIYTQLVEGFDAFQRGDDALAMQAYRRVLARAPRNRDALLGVAALHMRAGEVQLAAADYVNVLARNPRDAAAQAGLIALQENLDPIAGEARLKNFLAQDPQDANLLFTLGNLYAEQRRWAEAQQAFFNAYRVDDANPDYAFNLAVSLDRLSQGKAALEYYRRAAELAGRYPASFELAAAQRRAAELAGP